MSTYKREYGLVGPKVVLYLNWIQGSLTYDGHKVVLHILDRRSFCKYELDLRSFRI